MTSMVGRSPQTKRLNDADRVCSKGREGHSLCTREIREGFLQEAEMHSLVILATGGMKWLCGDCQGYK